jgi:hypothetical protein
VVPPPEILTTRAKGVTRASKSVRAAAPPASTPPKACAPTSQPTRSAGPHSALVWRSIKGCLSRHHDNGVTCYPLHVEDPHAVPCSSCGGELRLVVKALPGIIHGMHDGIACACGARWRFESRTRPGISLYVAMALAARVTPRHSVK